MITKVNLDDTWRLYSSKEQSIWVKGYLQLNVAEEHLSMEQEQNYFYNEFREEDIINWAGCFAVIYQDEEKRIAAVDRKRSYPLFYFQQDGVWAITDRVPLRQIERDQIDEVSVFELLLSGYVANNRTLLKQVNQVEAGHYAVWRKQNDPEHIRYFAFYHRIENNDMTVEEASQMLESVFYRVFEQQMKRISDKHIMIPLSGGYDSRIIALMLKEYGADNIKSFTYGIKGNKESSVSKQIADRLGIPWSFYEYTKQDWGKWFSSAEWWEYVNYSSHYVSIPHIQDWPSIKQLTAKEQDDYVFLPGHTGDFVSGSHIPPALAVKGSSFAIDDVVDQIVRKHHRLWSNNNDDLWESVRGQIKLGLKGFAYEDNEGASSLFEYWDWKERQAKFIINAVRAYEFYKQSWDIPLWDDQLVEFFLKVPVHLRYNKYLYDFTLHRMFPDYFPALSQQQIHSSVPRWKQGALYKGVRTAYAIKLLLEQYHRNPMGWFGITGNYMQYLSKTRYRWGRNTFYFPYNINSFIATEYLQFVSDYE